MNKIITILAVVFLLVGAQHQEDKGQLRLKRLRQMTAQSSTRIIQFNTQLFKQYALSYPRPYDIVIYFKAPSCKLCEQLEPQYNYMAELYYQQGAITAQKNPTFFVRMGYSRDSSQIFEMFSFLTAPNLVVSKPAMAVVSQIEKKAYYQKFKWAISYSDGHVTTHKMLQFANKRTDRNIIYKPTFGTMILTFFGFVSFAAIGVLVYIKMKVLWTNWLVWFLGSMLIYAICVSGVVYDIIHDVPFVGRDPKTGQALVFSDGNREQYGAQGFVMSFLLSGIGFIFIGIFTIAKKLPTHLNQLSGLVGLVIIFFLVFSLEDIYKSKSWYGPAFSPPEGYLKGPISVDQGNNI